MIIYVLIFIFILFYFYKENNINKEFFKYPQNSNNIWMYWENKYTTNKPRYLELCYDTVIKHCIKDFNIYLLNEKTIYQFLPNLRKDINKLTIPQKVDYIRLHLLYKYGGIWLDSDIIVMNNLLPIMTKLKDYDYVGFGCHFKNCKKGGYPKPANWVMASRKNGILVNRCIKYSNQILKNNSIKYLNNKKSYFKLGRELLWNQIKYCKKYIPNWDYYHYNSRCIERDSNYKKLRNNRLISEEDIDSRCENKMLFIPIYNTAPGFPTWFLSLTKSELLKQNMLISKLFRKSLY